MNNLDMPHLSTKDSAINCAETEYVVLGLPLEYLQKLDDPLEALVLSRITHWYLGEGVGRRLKSSSHKWLTKTTAELMAETGIKKEKQIRDALHALEHKHKLIEVVVGGFAGKKTKFIRLLCANGKSTITGWQQVFDAHHSVNTTHVTAPILTSVNTTHASVDTTLLIAVVTCSGDLESKPVDEKTTSTVIFESHLKSGEGEEPKSKASLTTTKKPRKIFKLGTVFDETRAKHYPSNLQQPKPVQGKVYKNLRDLKDRMLKADYMYEQVERYVRFLAGENGGWGILITNWGEQFNPADHVKEKVPDFPDLRWIVGSPDHGTGWHRNEIALDIWHAETGEPRPDQSEQQEQEQAAWLAEQQAHKAEMAAAIKKANAEHLALKAAKATQQASTPMVNVAVTAGTPEAGKPVAEAVSEPTPIAQVGFVLDADDYEFCDEPPESDCKSPQLKAYLTSQEQKKWSPSAPPTPPASKTNKANMFQSKKPMHRHANAAAA